MNTKSHTNRRSPRFFRLVSLIGILLISLVSSTILAKPDPSVALNPTDRAEVFQWYIDAVWNDGDARVLREIVNSEHIYTEAGNVESPIMGSDALLARIQNLHGSEIDVSFAIDKMMESDDEMWAVLNLVTDNMPWAGDNIVTPAYGDRFENKVNMIVTFDGFQIAETWLNLNITGLFLDMTLRMGEATAPLVEQHQIEIVQQLVDEVWNTPVPDPNVVDEVYASAFTLHDGWWLEVTETNPDEFWNMQIKRLRWMMPDLAYTIHTIAAEYDRVIIHYTATGIWQNGYCQATVTCGTAVIPPTQRRITWDGLSVLRFEDDKVVEQWDYMDTGMMFAVYEQAGVTTELPTTRSED